MSKRLLGVPALVGLAGLTLSATSAISLTQSEINAAVATVAKSSGGYSECLRTGGGKLEQTTEVKDINGDGIDEVILTETGAIGASFCFGMVGQEMSVFVSDGAGGWRTALSVSAVGLRFIKRAGNAWPDIEIDGGRSCLPIWRMQQGNGSYDIWKKCQKVGFVDAASCSPVGSFSTTTPLKGSVESSWLGNWVPRGVRQDRRGWSSR